MNTSSAVRDRRAEFGIRKVPVLPVTRSRVTWQRTQIRCIHICVLQTREHPLKGVTPLTSGLHCFWQVWQYVSAQNFVYTSHFHGLSFCPIQVPLWPTVCLVEPLVTSVCYSTWLHIALRKLSFNSYIKVVGYLRWRSLCCFYLLAEQVLNTV